MLERDDDRLLRVEPCDQDRLIDGLAPARQESDPSRPPVRAENVLDEQPGELRFVVVPQPRIGGEVPVSVECILDRRNDTRVPVTEIAAHRLAAEIENPLATGDREIHTLCVDVAYE